MRFNIEDYTEYGSKIAMHCPDEESAKFFGKYLDVHGLTWCNGDRYKEHCSWVTFGENTCYYFNEGTFGSVITARLTNGVKVIDFYDFDWDESCIDNNVETKIIMSFEEMFYGCTVENQTTI